MSGFCSSSDELRITPGNPPNRGLTFVNHELEGRSGHLGHALVEYGPNELLAFYPNCSGEHNRGHSAVGWMEFKRSTDGGLSWSDGEAFPYSKHVFDAEEGRAVMSEKAVRTADGDILVINLECDISESAKWRPYGVPTFVRSPDGGKTWSEPDEVTTERGRVYDAVTDTGDIFVLEFENDAEDTWYGTKPEHAYGLHVSTDDGESFSRRSELPFETDRRGYGALQFIDDGSLIAYVYHLNDERHLEYTRSPDRGQTWGPVHRTQVSKKIRNPQITRFRGRYFLHGRSGNYGYGKGNFVLYTSENGIDWDSGTYLRMKEARAGAYSNNLVVGALNPDRENRLLIQASHAYEKSKTNIVHWWID